MKELTQKEINDYAESIEKMEHFEMCRVWRFTNSEDPRISNAYTATNGKTLGTIFSDRLYKHFGGFTPAISKELGWEYDR